MVTKTQAKKTTTPLVPTRKSTSLRYSPTKSLDEAAGLLRDRYADLRRHYRKIRSEWR